MQDNPTRIPVNRKLLACFFSKIKLDPSKTFNGTPCWLWTAHVTEDGYGRIQFRNRSWNAHRLSLHMFVEITPPKQHTDHLCRVHSCVNPAHLEGVPPRINILRGEGQAAQHAKKTHCENGHELTPENTRVPKRNPLWRECRECAKQAGQKRKALQPKKRPQTHCAKGHLMRPPGPYKHRCLVCVNENGRRARQRKKHLP